MIDANAPHSATRKTLDPKPWMTREVWEGRIQVFRITRQIDVTDIFRPRPEYSQNIEDYQ